MTALDYLRPHGKSWAGLVLGPTCWAISTQLNYALVPWFCARRLDMVPVIAVGLVAISLIGALWSWLAWHRHDGPGIHLPEQDGHPHHLLCGIGVASGVLFAIVIAMQGVAGLILNACVR
jgi:hypothetical protein